MHYTTTIIQQHTILHNKTHSPVHNYTFTTGHNSTLTSVHVTHTSGRKNTYTSGIKLRLNSIKICLPYLIAITIALFIHTMNRNGGIVVRGKCGICGKPDARKASIRCRICNRLFHNTGCLKLPINTRQFRLLAERNEWVCPTCHKATLLSVASPDVPFLGVAPWAMKWPKNLTTIAFATNLLNFFSL